MEHPPSSEPFYDREGFNQVLTADPGEFSQRFGGEEIQGRIPEELAGWRYVLNGPARVRFGDWVIHPFDGHGYLRAFQFLPGGRVDYRATFVKTAAYEAEGRSPRPLYRALGTLIAPPDIGSGGFFRNLRALTHKNVANTTVYVWGGALFAGWEGGVPYRLDPDTYQTLGPHTFDGALPEREPFLAHVRVDGASGRLVGLSPRLGKDTTLVFREFDAQGRQVSTRSWSRPGALFVHDFAITPRYYVITSNPLRIDVPTFLKAQIGMATLLQALRTRPDAPGEVILIPRDPAGQEIVGRLPWPAFSVHHAGAFEREDGSVVLDTCIFPDFTFGREFGFVDHTSPLDPEAIEHLPAQWPWRVTLQPTTGQVDVRLLLERAVDFPRIHPDREGVPYDIVWGAARSAPGRRDPFDSVVKLDTRREEGGVTLWSPGGPTLVGEPVFIPRAGGEAEDDGYVVVMTYLSREGRSELCVLDGRDLARGPVARLPLPHLVPYGFHGGAYYLG